MQPQSKAVLDGQQNISKLKSHRFFSPEYRTNISRTEINEQYLMSRLAQGDETAFWNLWEQYRSYLHICCLRWLGTNRYEVDDALSRASIKALNNLLNNGHNIINLKGWLSRLTRNICVDIIRERNRHRRSLYRIGELAEVGEWHHAYSPPTAEEVLLQSEMSAAVRRAVKGLPCRLQLPSMMRFFQEMPYQDIARKLNITPANARKRIQQARAIIQDQLDPYLRGVGDPLVAVNEEDTHHENTCELPSERSDIKHLESDTIKPCIAPYRLIRVKLRNKMEMEYYVPIKNMPKRIHQKIRTLKKYTQKHPRSWRKRLKLADFLYVTGDWSEAVDNYWKVVDMKPSFFQVWLQLGNILHLIGEDGDAVVALKRALELTKNSASRHYVLGLIEICRRQYRKANGHFKKAASLESDNPAHWHGLGATSLQRCKFGAAIRAYDNSLKIDPEDTVALINSHDALMASEKENEALTLLEKALAISPDDVLGLLRLAQFRIRSGLVFKTHGTETKRLIRETLSLAPQSIDALALLAIFYAAKGDAQRGAAILRQAVDLNQPNPLISPSYAWWLSLIGECKYSSQAVRSSPVLFNEFVNLLPRASDLAISPTNHAKFCQTVGNSRANLQRRWSIYETTGIPSTKFLYEDTKLSTP